MCNSFLLTCFQLQYVIKESQNIKETADKEVDVEVDLVPLKSDNSNLKNVVLKILPKSVSEAKEEAVLVASHIDFDAAYVLFILIYLPS